MGRITELLKQFFIPEGSGFCYYGNRHRRNLNLPFLLLCTVAFWYGAEFVVWLYHVWPNLFTAALAMWGSLILLFFFWLGVTFIAIIVVYRIWAMKNGKKIRI